MAPAPDPESSARSRIEAERDFHRVRDEVARRQAVAAAEHVLTAAWIGELERLRIGLLHAADQHSLDHVHDVRAGRGHAGIEPNRVARLAEVILVRQVEPDEVAPLLRDVADALDAARMLSARRVRQCAEDLEWLRLSRERAYGKDPA